MASYTKYFREYVCTYTDGDDRIITRVYTDYNTQEYFSPLPTKKEINELFGTTGKDLSIESCFEDCLQMKASPKLPEEIYDGLLQGLYEIFRNCQSLIIPPKLIADVRMSHAFKDCTALVQAPVIPICQADVNISYMFQNCTSLVAPCSIPPGIGYIHNMFDGCSNMGGEIVVRSSPSSLSNALHGTVKPITLYGDKATCESIAATANNGNASWSAWYDPVPAVTDRRADSYTTAADMTRMVRNGALAVNSYAPGRMVFQQGDIVREDEWNALVEAAKTIDPTVTYSTNYSNLNKIEAAFDSAL